MLLSQLPNPPDPPDDDDDGDEDDEEEPSDDDDDDRRRNRRSPRGRRPRDRRVDIYHGRKLRESMYLHGRR